MGSLVCLEGIAWENCKSLCQLYEVSKRCYESKRFGDLPLYLRRFFEKGPDHFIMRNNNFSSESLKDERAEYSDRNKALLALSALERMFNTLVPKIVVDKTYTVTFIASIHDGQRYLVKVDAILEELLSRRSSENVEFTFTYKHSVGIGDKYTITAQRIGAFSLSTLVIESIHKNEIDVAGIPPLLLVNRD